MAFDPSAPLQRSPDIVASDVDGEFVLINIANGQYYGLDTVGSAIWRLLEAPHSTAALVETLQAQFDGDAGMVERETLAFIDQLAAQSLVQAA